MTTIIGPTPCHGCGAPVSWDGVAWLDQGAPHHCRSWRARCMSDAEWELWRAANQATRQPALTPCQDCQVSFATAMAAKGMCNGTPGRLDGATTPQRTAGLLRVREASAS